jgi:UDP-N-acetylmuramoyl-tripeptide--D-alanyl-D-alanine ligase
MGTPIAPNHAPLDARAVAAATGGWVVREHANPGEREHANPGEREHANPGEREHANPGAHSRGRVARGVTTDSRAVTAGSAFVALRGDRHDGHAYVGAAIAAGAVLVVVERGRASSDASAADVVEVLDTLAAWGAIARAHLGAWRRDNPRGRVVAITGSAGKTTTKELCAALLRTAAPCHATAGNLNNRVGVPAVVLQVEPWHCFVVVEIGMSVPGEIAALAAVTSPDVAIITNVGLAHAAGVGGTLAGVAREKGALFEAVRPGGTVVANADDEAVLAELPRAPAAAVVTFGVAGSAGYRLVSRHPLGADGSRVVVGRPGAETATFRVPIPGQAAAVDFVAALAAAEAAVGARLDNAQVAAALQAIPLLPGRMNVRRLGADVTVLDDAYNASPATMRASLATLAEVSRGRRVAVLGEMKALGPTAQREHVLLGAAVADAGVAELVTCGGLAEATAVEAARRGVAVSVGRDVDDAARLAIERVRPGDSVLVKASRSVGAERVVEALVRAHGAHAALAPIADDPAHGPRGADRGEADR